MQPKHVSVDRLQKRLRRAIVLFLFGNHQPEIVGHMATLVAGKPLLSYQLLTVLENKHFLRVASHFLQILELATVNGW